MKFKDKDGNVFNGGEIDLMRDYYCGQRSCPRCPLSGWNNQRDLVCGQYIINYPAEAARLMGYEVIEDGEDINVPDICEKCIWEDTGECADCMNNNKFKICNPADCDETPETCINWGMSDCAVCMEKNNFEPVNNTDKLEDKPMTRETILEAARNLVCGDRERDYGDPAHSFQTIADLWMAYLRGKGYTVEIKPWDAAVMLGQLKVSRMATGRNKADSFIGACGYMSIAGELAGREG